MFTFLLSSRLFLHPYELMTRVCHLCVEQQRSGDALLDKVGGVTAGRRRRVSLVTRLTREYLQFALRSVFGRWRRSWCSC